MGLVEIDSTKERKRKENPERKLLERERAKHPWNLKMKLKKKHEKLKDLE